MLSHGTEWSCIVQSSYNQILILKSPLRLSIHKEILATKIPKKKGRKIKKFSEKKGTQRWGLVNSLVAKGYDSDALLHAAMYAARKENKLTQASKIKFLINGKKKSEKIHMC